jgi:hypothetical protein
MEDLMQLCVESFNNLVDNYNALEQRRVYSTNNGKRLAERVGIFEKACESVYKEEEQKLVEKDQYIKDLLLEKEELAKMVEDKTLESNTLLKDLEIANEKRAMFEQNQQRMIELEASIQKNQKNIVTLESKTSEAAKVLWDLEVENRATKQKKKTLDSEVEILTKENEGNLLIIQEKQLKIDELQKTASDNVKQKLEKVAIDIDQHNRNLAVNCGEIVKQIEFHEAEVQKLEDHLGMIHVKEMNLENNLQIMQSDIEDLDSSFADTSFADSEMPTDLEAELQRLQMHNANLQKTKEQCEREVEDTRKNYADLLNAAKERHESLKRTVANKNVDTGKLNLSTEVGTMAGTELNLLEKMKVPSPKKPRNTVKKTKKPKKTQK